MEGQSAFHIDFIFLNNFGINFFQYGAAICAPNQSFSLRDFSTRKINMEQLFPFEIRFFILRFCENLKINMEQLFALQICAFLSVEPQGCELRANLIKHKVWGGLFRPLGPHGAVLCPKEASQNLMFYKVFLKFAALWRP